MSRRPKDIGTDAERAVVRYLQANGFPHAERRALRGHHDAGDITGIPGVCWEVKARKRPPSDEDIGGWLAETETERLNAQAAVGVLVLRRANVGPANAGRWWAVLRMDQLAFLALDEIAHVLGERPRDPFVVANPAPVRLLLADVVTLLRGAGYGQPLDEVAPCGR